MATLLAAGAAAFGGGAGPGAGAAAGPASQPAVAAADDEPRQIVYRPPADAKPKARVDGGVRDRGAGDSLPALFLLTPDHAGRTVQEDPSVFWYLAEPVGPKVKFQLTVSQNGKPKPVLEVQLDGRRAGIGRLDLGEHKVKLQKGVSYKVAVSLVPGADPAPDDPFSSGMIERIDPPQALLALLKGRPGSLDRAVAFANQGIWYDALAELSAPIDAGARNAAVLLKQRAALLEQEGLKEAAAHDRAAAKAGPGPARDARESPPR